MMEETLDELGRKYNCDKSSLQRSKTESENRSRGHDYLRKYEFFLSRFRQREEVSLLELGIGPDWNMGASLKIWNDFFQRADTKIKMVDINPRAKEFEDDRVSIEVGDLSKTDFLTSLAQSSFDVIIDDASHLWGHQTRGFINLFPAVKLGGVYIIEDIHTSFGNMRDRYSQGEKMDTFQFLTSLSGGVVGDGQIHPLFDELHLDDRVSALCGAIDSITFIRHSCIICRTGYY